MRFLYRACVGTLIFGGSVLVQAADTGPTVAGSGYAAPGLIRVAPGQVMTFFVTGLKTVLPPDARTDRAKGLPLPTTLGGLSVRLRQPYIGGFSGEIPLFAVQQFDRCSDTATALPDCILTALTVEIPFELRIPLPEAASVLFAEVVIEENGVAGQPFLLLPVANNPHILTLCDLLVNSPSSAVICDPVVTHADGSLVSISNPATSDEVLVLYAVGLGDTSANPPAGVATPPPAPSVTTPFGLLFDYVDPLTISPLAGISTSPQTSILFAGLTPGMVGLYQINFRVRPLPPGFPECHELGSPNLTISLVSPSGAIDSAHICVDGTASSPSTASESSDARTKTPTSPFPPNTIWYPLGSNLTSLGQPIPPDSAGLPPRQTIGVVPSEP